MDKIEKDLGIDTTFTKRPRKTKAFTRVIDNIPHKKGLNFMCDLLIMPKTTKGHKYLLVLVDLANRAFDIEPMKEKSASAALAAMKQMFKRDYIKQPEASIKTDGGPEFKSEFDKFLYDHSIYHSVALPDRHSQMSSVESLNRELGRLFNGFMNTKEQESGERFVDWDKIIDKVREKLNEHRKLSDKQLENLPAPVYAKDLSGKFKVGDIVHRLLDSPVDALGLKQSTKEFRTQDIVWEKDPRKVERVLIFSGKVPVRYMLSGIDNASFTDRQLMPSTKQEDEYVVKSLIGKKTEKGKVYIRVWWKGYTKDKSTWEPRSNLIEDGFEKEILQLEKDLKSGKVKNYP